MVGYVGRKVGGGQPNQKGLATVQCELFQTFEVTIKTMASIVRGNQLIR